MSKHTPGPWEVNLLGNGNFKIGNFRTKTYVAEVELHPHGINEVGKANAALIAAAPELIDLLKRVSVELKRDLVGCAGLETTVAECNGMDDLLVEIDEAIAKAEAKP